MASRRETATTGSRGRIAAGDVLLRFGSPPGALAERLRADERPTPRPRPASPPAGPFPDVIDRVDEIERAGIALVAARPVLLHGPAGSGKTTLLRHLSRTAANDAPDGAGAWPDGTILLGARGVSTGDLLQLLFAALHASDTPVHATPLQLENGLRERQALVLVDDLHGSAEEIRGILETASACAFAIAAEDEVDEIDVVRVGLGPLPVDAGVELVGRATGREPSPLEAARIREIHRAVDGQPLLLLQTAALIHAGVVSLETASEVANEEDPPGALADRLDATLSGSPRRALLALEAMRPVGLAPSDAAAIAELEDPGGALEALAHRGLARVEGARYGAAGGLAERLAAKHDPGEWRKRALDHFATLAGDAATPTRSGPEGEALVRALDDAMEASRWVDAVALVRAAELDLALSGRWEAWGEVLERGLEAARAIDDRSAEAWALHERGTRALALDEAERATHDLERAVELREALGEEAAAAASRSNLSQLTGETPSYVPVGGGRPASSNALTWTLLAVALVVLGAIGFLFLGSRDGGPGAVEVGSVRFADVAVGGESLAPVEVSHADSDGVEVGAVEIEGPDAAEFSIVTDGCAGASLEPDERCLVVVAFRPDEIGERSARLRVAFREDRPRAVELSGRGLEGPVDSEPPAGGDWLGIAPERVAFGSQPVGVWSGALPVAIVNRGEAPERVAVRLDPGPDEEFEVESDRCSNESLPVGGSCLVEIRFRPDGPGLRSGSLVVRDLGAGDTRTVAISGTGSVDGGFVADTSAAAGAADGMAATGAALSVATTAVDFGEVPVGTRGDVRSVEIENVGAEPVEIATVRLGGLDAAVFSVVQDRCSGRLLSPGATCSIDVRFGPAEEGGWSARLIVRDPTGEGVDVDLGGSGG